MNPADYIQCEDLGEEYCSHCGYPLEICNCIPAYVREIVPPPQKTKSLQPNVEGMDWNI